MNTSEHYKQLYDLILDEVNAEQYLIQGTNKKYVRATRTFEDVAEEDTKFLNELI